MSRMKRIANKEVAQSHDIVLQSITLPIEQSQGISPDEELARTNEIYGTRKELALRRAGARIQSAKLFDASRSAVRRFINVGARNSRNNMQCLTARYYPECKQVFAGVRYRSVYNREFSCRRQETHGVMATRGEQNRGVRMKQSTLYTLEQIEYRIMKRLSDILKSM